MGISSIRRFLVVFCAASFLCACGDVSHTTAPLPAANASRASERKTKLVVRIRVPKRPRRRRDEKYVSAATKAITLVFAGASRFTQTIALTPEDGRCKGSPLVCTIDLSIAPGEYTVTTSTFDRAPVNGTIPAGAAVLSTASNVPIDVHAGIANAFGVALDGVVAALAVSDLPAAAAGTAFASPQRFAVTATDADGYTIVGTYARPVTLTDGDSSGATAIATSGLDRPPSGMLLSSTDGATLDYTGKAILPVEIGATQSGAASGGATFAPTGVVNVTLNTDASLGATPGQCPAGTSGDLRYAICNASAGDFIIFNCGATCTISLGAALPPIEENLSIDGGTFGRVVIDGGSAHRAFFVDAGNVTLANLQIQNVKALGGVGGSRSDLSSGPAANGGSGGGAGLGAGLFVNRAGAVVSVTNVYFLNAVVAGGAGGGATGPCCLGGPGGGDGFASPGALGAHGGDGHDGMGACTSPPTLGQPGLSGGTDGGGGAGGDGGDGAGGGNTASDPCNGGLAGYGGAGADGAFGGGGGGGGNAGLGGYSNNGAQGNGNYGGAGGKGGPGGGGGAGGVGAFNGDPGQGGQLSASVGGGNGGSAVAPYGGGGGAAAGPAIFVNLGTLTTNDSGASGSSATGGAAGQTGTDATPGTADATAVFNYAGSVNGNAMTGPIASALSSASPERRGAGNTKCFNASRRCVRLP
jgi:hypothetical protein